ncbi:hypothetical protein ACHAXS_006454, partial [Conticribra weissflogii]
IVLRTLFGSLAVFVNIAGAQAPVQKVKLVASDGAASDYFGYSVSISGDTAVVGSFLDDDKGKWSGSAYVFVRSGTAWIQAVKLVASDEAVKHYYSVSVSISGDTAVLGELYGCNDKVVDSAYVYEGFGAI